MPETILGDGRRRGRVSTTGASLAILVGGLSGCGDAQSGTGGGEEGMDADPVSAAVRDTAPAAPGQIRFFSYFNNGTVAPPGAYSVSIRISSDGRGRVDYDRGYGEVRDSLVFQVEPDSLRRFYAGLRARLALVEPTNEEADPPEVGGPVSSFRVMADSVEYRLEGDGVASLEGFLPEEWAEIRRRLESGGP